MIIPVRYNNMYYCDVVGYSSIDVTSGALYSKGQHLAWETWTWKSLKDRRKL